MPAKGRDLDISNKPTERPVNGGRTAEMPVAGGEARPLGLAEIGAFLSVLLGDAVARRIRPDPTEYGALVVLDSQLPIFYTSITRKSRVGIASFARRWKNAVTFVFPAWSIERPWVASKIRQGAARHRLINPGHQVIFLCNTAKETELLQSLGEVAIHINHNVFVSDRTFRPLGPRPLLYDALYNARLDPFKRHELTLEIERCGFIYYHAGEASAAAAKVVRERHGRLAPGHVFINRIEDGVLERLSPATVNELCNAASVGLCLSAMEGAMLASMEYLMAGLPIVSTPSLGGRDVYFDDDYCLIVEPDPRQIREAVAALKARDIPRDVIASRTREKVDRDRRRLLTLIDDLRERAGQRRQDAIEWPYHHVNLGERWKPWSNFMVEDTWPAYP